MIYSILFILLALNGLLVWKVINNLWKDIKKLRRLIYSEFHDNYLTHIAINADLYKKEIDINENSDDIIKLQFFIKKLQKK